MTKGNARAPRALLAAIALMVTVNSIAIGVLWDRTDERAAPDPDPSPRTSVLGETFPPPDVPVVDVTTEPLPPPDVVTPPDPVTVPEPATEPAAPRCVNSYDPACGRLIWDPAPGKNAPLTLDAWFTPEEPVTGQPITFSVRASDPDARPKCCDFGIEDGESFVTVWDCYETKYGRWRPPAKNGGTRSWDLTRTFDEPGTYTIHFVGRSGGACQNPYANRTAIKITFVVGEAPADPDAA